MSRILFNFLLELCTLPWLGEFFKFIVLLLMENAFASQKIGSRHFYLCSQAKLFSRLLSSSPRQREIIHPPGFFKSLLLPEERLREVGEEPMRAHKSFDQIPSYGCFFKFSTENFNLGYNSVSCIKCDESSELVVYQLTKIISKST